MWDSFLHLEIGESPAHLDRGDSPVSLYSSCLQHFLFVLRSTSEPGLYLFPISFSELLISPFLLLSPRLLPTSLPSGFVLPSHQLQGYATVFSVWAVSISSPWGFSHLLTFLFSSCLCRSHAAILHSSLPTPAFLLNHLLHIFLSFLFS